MPLAPERAAQPALHPVGDDEPPAADRHRAPVGGEHDAGHPGARADDVHGAGALHPDRPVGQRHVPDRGVELEAWHGAPGGGQRAAGPGQVQLLAEAGRAQPPVDRPPGQEPVEPEPLHLGDGPRGEPVAAALVAGEHRAVGEDDVQPGAGGPRGSGRPGGPRPDHEHVGLARQAGGGGGHRSSVAARAAGDHPGWAGAPSPSGRSRPESRADSGRERPGGEARTGRGGSLGSGA